MPDNTYPDIVCDVDVPRTDKTTSIPNLWVDDQDVDIAARGLAYHVVSYPRGTVVPGSAFRQHPLDPPASELIAALVDGGYLVPDSEDGSRYRLVHPDRLGPMPAF